MRLEQRKGAQDVGPTHFQLSKNQSNIANPHCQAGASMQTWIRPHPVHPCPPRHKHPALSGWEVICEVLYNTQSKRLIEKFLNVITTKLD